ncbi:venom serine protease 34 isoform X2 [Lepeophtheirus salmonis]|uniref:venom serine protease 34 isoform X2 n=1 Tax=Lepeophtheirus salmonis TaxID=72036 RepID=UPI003AF39E28
MNNNCGKPKLNSSDILMDSCSAQILTEKIVITAGHCVSGPDSKSYVITGYFNRKKDTDPHRVHEVKRIYIHPQYEILDFLGAQASLNDVAVLKIKDRIDILRPDIGTACLPIREFNTSIVGFSVGQSRITILGYGKTEKKESSCCLRYAENIATVSMEKCKRALKQYGSVPGKALMDITINENTFCIKGDHDNHKVTTCFGDSGGGSYFKTEDSRYVLVGITSFGRSNADGCDYRFPSVNTYINPYIGWILNVVHKTMKTGDNILKN